MWRRHATIALSVLILLTGNQSARASALVLFLHEGDSPLGWRAFVLFMVGLLFVVLLFDEMARRAIKSIRKHRRSSFVSRLMRNSPQIVARMRKLLSRARR